jgi:hypothetical protein
MTRAYESYPLGKENRKMPMFSYPVTIIDFKDRKKMLATWCYLIGLDSFSEDSDHHPQKNEPLSQEMHLEIPLLGWGLRLSNSKPGCAVPALYFFVTYITPMAF